jgi:hypothetical protein
MIRNPVIDSMLNRKSVRKYKALLGIEWNIGV